ncbi:unnamed protein product [Vitrella brassicaformis CCMP3155]|uniref:Uncharacterized protein n=1 Tax=Vitrella brassicaformis (strain CCMP3155) TaxID=1169540 RepID=A0A0G4EE69_VITBC|nr:unnamed protein product [Vitrella brassicaformis CCMP3155]|eukprot:CEL93634.1 unnamed protein product [Vitrella brassicaformis CCMP3155]
MSFEQPDEPMTDVGLYDIDLEEATGPKAVVQEEPIVGMEAGEAGTVEAGTVEAGAPEARAVPPQTGVSKPFIAAQKLDPTHAILMFFGSILFPPVGCVAFCRYSTDPDNSPRKIWGKRALMLGSALAFIYVLVIAGVVGSVLCDDENPCGHDN